MKIFYKKDFQRVCGELEEANGKIECLTNIISLMDSDLTKVNKKLDVQIERLSNVIEKFLLERTELTKKLEESMTDKYVLKKIPAGRTPNLNKTKVSKPVSGNVRNYMRKEFDE